MIKQYTYKSVALRFRRWSRKRYAAFISIQRAVTIGNLSANVSERFQTKNGSTHGFVLLAEREESGECSEEESIADNWLKADIPFGLLPAWLTIQTVKQPVAAAHAYTLIYNIPGKAEGFGKY